MGKLRRVRMRSAGLRIALKASNHSCKGDWQQFPAKWNASVLFANKDVGFPVNNN